MVSQPKPQMKETIADCSGLGTSEGYFLQYHDGSNRKSKNYRSPARENLALREFCAAYGEKRFDRDFIVFSVSLAVFELHCCI